MSKQSIYSKFFCFLLLMILSAGCSNQLEKSVSYPNYNDNYKLSPEETVLLDSIQHKTFLFFMNERNPENGLVKDRSASWAPASMMRRIRVFGAVLVLGLLVSVAALAQEKKPAMPSEEERAKMMEVWAKLATPGPNHKLLEPIVGSFNVQSVMWEYPGAPAQESTGTSEHVWVLGGRYVQQTFRGSFMGQPFEGIGYTGYDNYKKQFISAWIDTMGTSMLISSGTADATGKLMTFTGNWDDAVTGNHDDARGLSDRRQRQAHHGDVHAGPGR